MTRVESTPCAHASISCAGQPWDKPGHDDRGSEVEPKKSHQLAQGRSSPSLFGHWHKTQYTVDRHGRSLLSRVVRATVERNRRVPGHHLPPRGDGGLLGQGWAFAGTLMVSSLLVTDLYGAQRQGAPREARLRMGPTAEKTAAQKVIADLSASWSSSRRSSSLFLTTNSAGRPAFRPTFRYWATRSPCLESSFTSWWSNRYAASTIEVVEGQTVISTGPYAIVRHPMYAGAILVFLGTPLALGSWWGLLFTPLFIGWFAWRLLDEERFLRANLPGYDEYMRTAPYRLAPYIW